MALENDGTAELEELRRRAYGPDADIDPVSAARLALLERAVRAEAVRAAAEQSTQPSPETAAESMPSPSPESRVAGERSPDLREPGAVPSVGEKTAERGKGPVVPPGLQASGEEQVPPPLNGPRRPRLPWIIAGVATLIALVVAVPALLGAVTSPRPELILNGQGTEPEGAREAVEQVRLGPVQGLSGAEDYRWNGSLGDFEVWSARAESGRCVVLTRDQDTWAGRCAPDGFDLVIDMPVTQGWLETDAFEPAAPLGSYVRLRLAGADVEVYLIREEGLTDNLPVW